MICENCKPWAATTTEQWLNRQANMNQSPGVVLHKCEQCNGTDWATTREFIRPDPPPQYQPTCAATRPLKLWSPMGVAVLLAAIVLGFICFILYAIQGPDKD